MAFCRCTSFHFGFAARQERPGFLGAYARSVATRSMIIGPRWMIIRCINFLSYMLSYGRKILGPCSALITYVGLYLGANRIHWKKIRIQRSRATCKPYGSAYPKEPPASIWSQLALIKSGKSVKFARLGRIKLHIDSVVV